MRNQIFRSWYARLWTVWVIIFFGDDLIAWLLTKGGYPTEEVSAFPISLLIGLIVFAGWMALLERYPEHQATVPDRDRLPRVPIIPAEREEEETHSWEHYPDWDDYSDDEPPIRERRTIPSTTRPVVAIELLRLTLLVRQTDGRLRYDTMVRPEDMGIRPFLQYTIPEGSSLIGKKLTLRFKILGPRRLRRPNWTLDDEVFFSEPGQFDVWPQTEEFLVAGQDCTLGTWRLAVEFVTTDLVRPLTIIEFRIAESINVTEEYLEDDAALSSSARRKIADNMSDGISLADIFNGG